MPGLHSSESNGLLALLYAAQCMESSDEKKSRTYTRTSHYSESKLSKEKKSLGSRCSHNELEKRRRGYLKHCMELLKERLDFKTETARITTLSVLKKAKNEILNTNDEIAKFDDLVKKEKMRSQIISKRKFQIKKKLEERNNLRRALSWRERNRNYSECSVATTSSEESELDYYATRQTKVSLSTTSKQHQQQNPQMTTMRSLTPMLPPRKHLTSISEHGPTNKLSMLRPANLQTAHQPDGSSSDSGYEEINSLTPPGTSECLSPMDVSAAAAPSSSSKSSVNSITKANQMIHRDATIAVLQGTIIPKASYWNTVGNSLF